MGFRDIIKDTATAVLVAQAVITGFGYPADLQKQLADWSRLEASSWVQRALTEGEVADRVKAKASSMR